MRSPITVINRLEFGYPNVSLYSNYGDGTFAARVDYTVSGEDFVEGLAPAFLPGHPGPALMVSGTLGASVILREGPGAFARSVLYGTSRGPQDVVPADFDGDDDLDLGSSNEVESNFSIHWHRACDIPLGDFDGDGDVDLSDFVRFQLCYGGSNNPPAPTCPPAVDADGDVDLADFLIFQQNFTGSL